MDELLSPSKERKHNKSLSGVMGHIKPSLTLRWDKGKSPLFQCKYV